MFSYPNSPVYDEVSKPLLTEFGIRPTEIGMTIAIELEMLTALLAPQKYFSQDVV